MTMVWLWAALTLLVVMASVALVVPLAARRADARELAIAAEQAPVLAGLAQELAGIDRQLAEGTLAPSEAAALRASIRRRMQEEAAIVSQLSGNAVGGGDGGTRWLAYALAASVTVGAAGLYGWMGRPDIARQAGAPPGQVAVVTGPGGQPSGADAEVQQLVRQLEARLAAEPGDSEGWRMLGWSRFELGDYRGAAEAYGRAVELQPRNALYLSALGEAQVMATGGEITPAARAIFRRAVEADPGDVRARYYLAAARDQDGDTAGAVEDWLKLVAEAPSAPWVAQLAPIIRERAEAAGIDVRARLPAAAAPAPPRASPGAPPAAPPGVLAAPTPEQVAEANAMSPADRQAMIRGMVDGLEARLSENPQDLEGWQRLIRARMVLGEEERARAAYAEARKAFAGRPAELEQLRSFARLVNLGGA
jgi:cytochrome c-type biogenesis protein CcmH